MAAAWRRAYSIVGAGRSGAVEVFSRATKRIQRDRAAAEPHAQQLEYLRDEVADRVVDRLWDVARTFDTVLDVGAGCGHVAKLADPSKVGLLVESDMSAAMLRRARETVSSGVPVLRVHADEELLPFAQNTFDAAVSSLSLHWVNDLPGAMAQINHALKPDSPFVAAMFGNSTLFELRTTLQQVEQERFGGLRQHVSPMADVRDLGSLLSRAGFTLTTVDLDRIVINYPDVFALVSDLRAMGESNAVKTRGNFVGMDALIAAAATYADVYKNRDGSIPATFDILYMIGWKPAPSQPTPKPRGSGQVSLKTALKTPAA